MRKALVAGNWKMNGTMDGARALASAVAAGISRTISEKVDVAVCPPFVFLSQVADCIAGSAVGLGAQNVSEHHAGAFTGEVSGSMLAALGCRYAIVGHSERRDVFGESDLQVAQKFVAAQAAGLMPILCVGERLEDRESGETEAVVERQLGAVLSEAGVAALADAVVAYEPVWAIGTGKTASPDEAESVHAFIRGRIKSLNPKIADTLRIVYGGSVKSSNAKGLFAMPNIDGGLIGGAALDADDFIGICTAAA